MFDDIDDGFGEPKYTGPLPGPRFEPMFEPEWQRWAILDHDRGTLYPCESEADAIREAEAAERVRMMVVTLAQRFTPPEPQRRRQHA